MDIPNIRAIIYDAGFTLISPHLPIQAVSLLICDRFGITADPDSFKDALALAQGKFVAVQKEDAQIWASEAAIRQLWTDYYAMALRQSGIDVPSTVVGACAGAIYDEYAKHEYWRAYSDAEETLAEGKRRGYIQGVVSDWGVQLPAILHQLGLTKYLDFVVVSSLVGVAKPNPRIFELALSRAEVKSHEAIYVGDSYHTDIIGARAAGMNPVFLDRDGLHRNLDCPIVGSLGEVLKLANQGQTAGDRQNVSGS